MVDEIEKLKEGADGIQFQSFKTLINFFKKIDYSKQIFASCFRRTIKKIYNA